MTTTCGTTSGRSRLLVAVLALIVALTALVALGSSPATAEGAAPNAIGTFDQLTSPGPGTVRVAGWAFDDDAMTAPVDIHAYVGAPAGAPGAQFFALGAATAFRPDVGAAYPGRGDYHGFDITFAPNATGQVPVYLYAINRPGTAGDNTYLGTKTVTVVPPPITVVRAPVVVGALKARKRLAVGPTTWSPTDSATTVQWLRNGVAIPGATQPVYRVPVTDRRSVISVVSTATRAGYVPASVTTTAGKIKAGKHHGKRGKKKR